VGRREVLRQRRLDVLRYWFRYDALRILQEVPLVVVTTVAGVRRYVALRWLSLIV
jgi:hypothetical protein